MAETAGSETTRPRVGVVTGHLGVAGDGQGHRCTLLVGQGFLNPLGAYFYAARPHHPSTLPADPNRQELPHFDPQILPLRKKKKSSILCV